MLGPCRYQTVLAVLLLGSFDVVSSQTPGMLRLSFLRNSPDQNGIILSCREAMRLSIINNAIFQANGMDLNTVAAAQYAFNITQQLEGNFTCYRDGEPGLISLPIQLAELPTVYDGVTPKTLYIHRGDVGEIPCDYQPGLAKLLYSGNWIRGLGTVDPSKYPYQGLSQANYSLFFLADETDILLDGVQHQCSVQVKSCSGACSNPTPQLFSGAVITVNIIEPPNVHIITPDSLVIPVDEAVDLTCAPVGEHIASIDWSVDGIPCSQDPSCSIKLEMPNSRTISVLATSTTTERVVECKVIQILTSEEIDIVNPEYPEKLVDEVEFQFFTAVTVTVAEPSSSIEIESSPTSLTLTPSPASTPRYEGSDDQRPVLVGVLTSVICVILVFTTVILITFPLLRWKCNMNRTSQKHIYDDVGPPPLPLCNIPMVRSPVYCTSSPAAVADVSMSRVSNNCDVDGPIGHDCVDYSNSTVLSHVYDRPTGGGSNAYNNPIHPVALGHPDNGPTGGSSDSYAKSVHRVAFGHAENRLNGGGSEGYINPVHPVALGHTDSRPPGDISDGYTNPVHPVALGQTDSGPTGDSSDGYVNPVPRVALSHADNGLTGDIGDGYANPVHRVALHHAENGPTGDSRDGYANPVHHVALGHTANGPPGDVSDGYANPVYPTALIHADNGSTGHGDSSDGYANPVPLVALDHADNRPPGDGSDGYANPVHPIALSHVDNGPTGGSSDSYAKSVYCVAFGHAEKRPAGGISEAI